MKADRRERLLQVVERNHDKAVSFLRKMISIPSVTGAEAAIQKYLADYLAEIGLEVDMWETDWDELKKHPGKIPVTVKLF